MPSPITTTLLVFGAVLTALDGVTGVVVAGLGVAFEAFLTFVSAKDPM